MELLEEWKPLWTSSSFSSPSSSDLGPVIFNPIPETLTLLLSSSNLSPDCLSPPPHLSDSGIIKAFAPHDAPVLPTTASSICTSIGPHDHLRPADIVRHSRLEPLYCSNNRVLVFFPTGTNLHRVGFLDLSVRASNLVVDCGSDVAVFTSEVKFDQYHRIVRLSACPVSDPSFPNACVGYLLACTLYAVHWFTVKIIGHCLDSGKPALVEHRWKLFNSCAVAHACWNPHLPDESVVLLESGELFLFDMSSCSSGRILGKRIKVLWDQFGELAESRWFSCEFSWHPRILVVANSKAVYLVDFRSDRCRPSCLLKLEMLMDGNLGKDQLVALSKAGSDGFFYTVASEYWVLLCDVRKPFMPVLRWAHNLQDPRYMTVLPLSDLRSHPCDEKYAGASDMGFAIILGSFSNNDFCLFCYGRYPPVTKHATAKILKFSDSFYAWELPSQLSLCGRKCHCGTCVLREEVLKDGLPEWIEWQQKKQLVLGFFILNKDLFPKLPRSQEHGGFALIRLISSGKLELQQYRASWKMSRFVAIAHEETSRFLKDSLLCSMGEEKYKFPRRFKYVKLEYLYAHLNDNLAKLLRSKLKSARAIGAGRKCSNERSRKFLSEKLKSFGCNPSTSDVFRDINMPTSLYEIVCRAMWLTLPMDILEVAFSDYTEVLGAVIDPKSLSLDFPVISDENQLPPFFLRNPSQRSNTWSTKVKRTDDFLGPVVPLPVSSFMSKANEMSLEEAFSLRCNDVMRLAKEMGVINSGNEQDREHTVSLLDDREETWGGSLNPSPFFLYEPSAFSDELLCLESEGSDQEDRRYKVMISKLPENGVDKETNIDGMELFDDLCPVELKFDCDKKTFADEELKAYQLLKRQFSQWQDGFIPFQNLSARIKPN